MTLLRAVLVAALAVSSVPTRAEPPGGGKAKRLAPVAPSPTSVAVPEEPKAPVVGSCDMGATRCADYQGVFAGVDTKALCAKAKGSWSASRCPTERSVGTCTQRQDRSEDRIVTRSYAPEQAEAARKACVNLPRGIFLKSYQAAAP